MNLKIGKNMKQKCMILFILLLLVILICIYFNTKQTDYFTGIGGLRGGTPKAPGLTIASQYGAPSYGTGPLMGPMEFAAPNIVGLPTGDIKLKDSRVPKWRYSKGTFLSPPTAAKERVEPIDRKFGLQYGKENPFICYVNRNPDLKNAFNRHKMGRGSGPKQGSSSSIAEWGKWHWDKYGRKEYLAAGGGGTSVLPAGSREPPLCAGTSLHPYNKCNSGAEANWECYVKNHPDLLAAFKRNPHTTSMSEWGEWHWEIFGHKEKFRSCNCITHFLNKMNERKWT